MSVFETEGIHTTPITLCVVHMLRAIAHRNTKEQETAKAANASTQAQHTQQIPVCVLCRGCVRARIAMHELRSALRSTASWRLRALFRAPD